MAAINLSIFQPSPCQAAEFLSLARDYGQYLDGFGGRTGFRRTLFAGDAIGHISLVNLFPDAAARAAALDKILADRENNPMRAAMASASPPVTLLGSSLLDSIDPAAPIPDPPNVLTAFIFEASPASRGEAIVALKAAIARHTSLGASATAWQIGTGPRVGSFLYAVGADSMAAGEELRARNQALSEPPPLAQAGQAGVLSLVELQVSVIYDV